MTLAALFRRRFEIRVEFLTLAVAILLATVYNAPLWRHLFTLHSPVAPHDALFLISLLLFLVAVFTGLLLIFAFRYVYRPLIVLTFLTAPVALYYMQAYGVMIDASMIQNVVETDSREAVEQLSWGLLGYFLLLGVIPAGAVAITIRPRFDATVPRQVVRNAVGIAGCALAIAAIVYPLYQDYASLFRNHRELRLLVNPTNYLYAGARYYWRANSAGAHAALRPIGEDAARASSWAAHHKHAVVVLVVGETARAQNFGVFGYARNTTPHLAEGQVHLFNNFYSCGTTTSVSVPCMFSLLSGSSYDEAQAHGTENVLDVIARAGFQVIWRDNNSGCKGVCDRVEYEDVSHAATAHCTDQECFDEVLLDHLEARIRSSTGDVFVVLHQKGSHGPAYYERVPAEFKQFLPDCENSELQQCSRDEIVNAYDNTILYTDYFLWRLIALLQNLSTVDDTAMIYVSDHGESLGERNLYLHGTPYFIAPEEQIHIPFAVWLSEGFRGEFGVDESCIEERKNNRYTHANLFHSLLGLMAIDTAAYEADLDLFSGCMRQPALANINAPAIEFHPESAKQILMSN